MGQEFRHTADKPCVCTQHGAYMVHLHCEYDKHIHTTSISSTMTPTYSHLSSYLCIYDTTCQGPHIEHDMGRLSLSTYQMKTKNGISRIYQTIRITINEQWSHTLVFYTRLIHTLFLHIISTHHTHIPSHNTYQLNFVLSPGSPTHLNHI